MIETVDAAARLDRLEFDPGEEVREHVAQLAAYRCPHCGREREFGAMTLRNHQNRASSPLAAEWAMRFDEARPLDPARRESRYDFHCPGCGCPAGVIFEPGREFAMDACTWRLIAVVELGRCLHATQSSADGGPR